MRKLVLAAALCAALTVGPVALGAVFVTPKKALYCEVKGDQPQRLVCWRPSNGFTVQMTSTGRAGVVASKANRGRHDAKKGRLLRYGKTWSRGGWTCTSRKLSLICLNAKAHGWALGPARGFHSF